MGGRGGRKMGGWCGRMKDGRGERSRDRGERGKRREEERKEGEGWGRERRESEMVT